MDVLENALQRGKPPNEIAEVVGFLTGRLTDERPLYLSDLFCLGLVKEKASRR